MENEVIPFSRGEGEHGIDVAHKRCINIHSRLTEQDVPTLCRVAGLALKLMRSQARKRQFAWQEPVSLDKVVTQALIELGCSFNTSEAKARKRLYVQAVSAMFGARKRIKSAHRAKDKDIPVQLSLLD